MRYIEIRIKNSLVLLTEIELITLLATNKSLYIKGFKRGKSLK